MKFEYMVRSRSSNLEKESVYKYFDEDNDRHDVDKSNRTTMKTKKLKKEESNEINSG